MPNPSKAVRSALLVARRGRAPGGSLSDAISSFSKDREGQFNRPAGNSDAALLAALQSEHPQLAVAEPPQQPKQSASEGVGDLGAQIDEGVKWLSVAPDDTKPAKGGPSNRIGAPAGMSASINSQPAHPGGPSHSNVDQNSAAMHMMDRLVTQHGWTPAAAAIAAGNAMQESGFQSGVAGDPSIPGGSHGYGQWNRDRFTNLQDFAKQQGTDWTNPDTQIDFLANEAKDRVPGWSAQTDLSQARPISKAYEGYGVEGNRVPDASKFYDMYQSRPQPQSAQGASPGPLSEADPMMTDPNANQAKRGGIMRRKHFDDGGDSGGDGDGDGTSSAAAAAAAADAAAAGFGGNSGVTGAPAGMGTSVGFGGGQGGTDAGVGGDNGFGGANGFGTSVGVNAPGNANAATGFGGVAAAPGNTGFGGGNAAAAGNSAPGGAGGVSTGAATGGNGGGGSGVSAALAAAYGASQMEGGHGGGGNGATALSNPYGGVPAYYNAGFGLGTSGVGNAAAAQSDTATMRGLIGGVAPGIRGIGAGVAPGYGFASVQGNDPGLAASNTGQAALASNAVAPHAPVSATQALAQAQSTMSPSQVAALNSQLAMLRSGGVQGYGNAGFGGGSPNSTVGGFGGNANSTGAEGVSTAGLGTPSVGIGTPSGPPGFASSVNANAPSSHASNVMGIGTPPGVNAPAPAPAPTNANQGTSGRYTQAQNAVERQNRGGYLHRASGGIASMPTDELIELALNRIRQRRKAAGGGGIGGGNTIDPSTGSILIGGKTAQQGGNQSFLNLLDTGDAAVPEVPGNQSATDMINAVAWGAPLPGSNSNNSSAAAATPAPNTPAVASGTVGNHGGSGAVGSSGVSGSPIGGIPNASPIVQPSSSTNPNGPQYSNSLNQALGTNNPTNDQIFGFSYPTMPPPKPQPQGPVSQDERMALSGIGQGSQLFASGGAIIMDAALNKARKAIKGNKRYV